MPALRRTKSSTPLDRVRELEQEQERVGRDQAAVSERRAKVTVELRALPAVIDLHQARALGQEGADPAAVRSRQFALLDAQDQLEAERLGYERAWHEIERQIHEVRLEHVEWFAVEVAEPATVEAVELIAKAATAVNDALDGARAAYNEWVKVSVNARRPEGLGLDLGAIPLPTRLENAARELTFAVSELPIRPTGVPAGGDITESVAGQMKKKAAAAAQARSAA
jgi:hypothetical protein